MTMDYILLFAAMLFGSVDKFVCRKYLRLNSNPDQFLFAYQLGCTILTAPFAFHHVFLGQRDLADHQNNQLALVLLILSLLAWICYAVSTFRSASRLELSVVSILGKLKLIWAVIFGLIFFGESLTIMQIFGIALIAASTINISIIHGVAGVDFKGVAYAIAASLSLAFALMLDKQLTKFFHPSVIAFFGFLGTFCFSMLINKGALVLMNKAMLKTAAAASLFGVLGYYLLLLSVTTLPLSIAIPLHQSSFIIDMLLGIFVLKETGGLRRRFVAAFVAFVGILLITGDHFK